MTSFSFSECCRGFTWQCFHAMNVQRSLSRLCMHGIFQSIWTLSYSFIHFWVKKFCFLFLMLTFFMEFVYPVNLLLVCEHVPKTCLYSILTLEAQILLMQSGVSEVIYFVEKRLSNSDAAYIASHKLLSMAGVKVVKFLNLLSSGLGDNRFEWCKLEFAGRLLQVKKHQPQMREILIKFEDPWKCIAGLHQAHIFSDEAY